MADPLDRVSFTDKCSSSPSSKSSRIWQPLTQKLITHSLGLVNRALGAHRPSESPNAPNSLLRALKLWYILPALLHFQDGRMSRTERFKSAEREDLTMILPWLIEYTEGTATRLRGPAREATDATKFERAALA